MTPIGPFWEKSQFEMKMPHFRKILSSPLLDENTVKLLN